MVTKETATMLLGLLAQVSVSAVDPDIEAKVAALVKAKAELEAVVNATDDDPA